MKQNIRLVLRGMYRITNGFLGFGYDFRRFVAYGGWREKLHDREMRNYNIMMAYHGLEKSLSYKNRDPNAGWRSAEKVYRKLTNLKGITDIGFHDKAAKNVLTTFLNLPPNRDKLRTKEMLAGLEEIPLSSDEVHGAMDFSGNLYRQGILADPETFFNSRHSLREYKDEIVQEDAVKRAIKLAMKTPSVCNRHAWHVYHTSDRETIDKALSYQNGNRPFGKKIPNLLIITTDLKAFFAGHEHYQHWIDGGLFSMSIMYALHSIGLASCPLNWAQKPKIDRGLRKAINIRSNHTVIMMMALGYPDENNKVCRSIRRPLDDIYSEMKIK
ncbi:MAG: nitroreductase [Eudoraea sp.]|nr:nitroreductase [Eudoraea sp.]